MGAGRRGPMKIDIPQKLMLELAELPPEEQRAWLAKLSPRDQLLLDAAFEAWHARGQLEPPQEDWRVWLMLAGRGFGKTRAGAEWIHQLAWSRPGADRFGRRIDRRGARGDGRRFKRPAERRQAAAPPTEVGAEPGAADLAAGQRRPALFGRSCRRAEGAGTSFRLVRSRHSMRSWPRLWRRVPGARLRLRPQSEQRISSALPQRASGLARRASLRRLAAADGASSLLGRG
jgi:hypothetical protein